MSPYPIGDVRPATFVLRLRDFFLARPNQWVLATQLEAVAGRQAWRTRVSDVRREFQMRIENRWRTITREDGSSFRISEYRYVPETWTERAESSPDGVAAKVEGRLF